MSSELERRTAIIVALRLRPCAKENIDFFKFPKLLFTALPSPQGVGGIEEGFLTPELPPTRPIGAKLVLENLDMS
ncbi:Hypothetical protein FKW44_023870, partial [Caligus rogercresseyi]